MEVIPIYSFIPGFSCPPQSEREREKERERERERERRSRFLFLVTTSGCIDQKILKIQFRR